MTSLLCDLLDDETENDESLAYPRKQLKEDLAKSDEAMTISCRIESIEYLPEQERYVTQGDLGLIVAYRDRVSGESWERGWLLQAKRATPSLRNRPAYRANSRFGVDSAQRRRIEVLEKVVGGDFVRYLLYAPRPAMLGERDRARLAQARNSALAGHIYDYLFGQALYEDAKAGCPTLAAGMLLARHSDVPTTVLAAHSQLAQTVWPFSWFISLQFGGMRVSRLRSPKQPSPNSEPKLIWHLVGGVLGEPGIPSWNVPVIPFLRGDHEVVQLVIHLCGEVNDNVRDYKFLPPHTMTVEVSPGGALPGQGADTDDAPSGPPAQAS